MWAIKKNVASWHCKVSALLAVSAKLRQPTGQRLCNVRMQQKTISMGPILFLYYEESLVSSNLNSKLFRFHSAHPNLHIWTLMSIFYHIGDLIKKALPIFACFGGLDRHNFWFHQLYMDQNTTHRIFLHFWQFLVLYFGGKCCLLSGNLWLWSKYYNKWRES